MAWNLALVITEVADRTPVPGILVTVTVVSSLTIVIQSSTTTEATTDASGAATVTFSTGSGKAPAGLNMTPPQPPSATGDWTTWNIALVLTNASDGSPVPGCNVFVEPGVAGTASSAVTSQTGAATVTCKVFASAPQALPMTADDPGYFPA
jgi:hypothetical protein